MPKLIQMTGVLLTVLFLAGCGDSEPLPPPSTNVSFELDENQEPTAAIEYAARAYQAIQAIASVQQVSHDLLALNHSTPVSYTFKDNRCGNNTAGGIYQNDNDESTDSNNRKVSVSSTPIVETYQSCILSSNEMRVNGLIRTTLSDIDDTLHLVRVTFSNVTITPAQQELSFTLNGSYTVQVDIGTDINDTAGFTISNPENFTITNNNGTTLFSSGTIVTNLDRSNNTYNSTVSTNMIFNELSSEQLSIRAQSITGQLSNNALLHPITGGDISIAPIQSFNGDNVQISPLDLVGENYELRIRYETANFTFPRNWAEDQVAPVSPDEDLSLSTAENNTFISRSYNALQALTLSQEIINHTLLAGSRAVCGSNSNGGYSSTPAVGVINQVFENCILLVAGHTIISGSMILDIASIQEDFSTGKNTYVAQATFDDLLMEPVAGSNASASQYLLSGSYNVAIELNTDLNQNDGFQSIISGMNNYKVGIGISDTAQLTFSSGSVQIDQNQNTDRFEISGVNAVVQIDDRVGTITLRTPVNLSGPMRDTPSRPIFPHNEGEFTLALTRNVVDEGGNIVEVRNQSLSVDASDGNDNTYTRTFSDNGNIQSDTDLEWSDL